MAKKTKKEKKSAKKRPKSATVKKKKKKGNPVAKNKSRTKGKRISKLECFIKGGFGGAGVGETVGFGVEAVGVPPQIAVPARIGAAAAGGYYIGGKKIEGLLGGVVFELIPSAISLFTQGGRGSRLGGL